MKKWTQKEIDFLKENYEKTLNKELVLILNRNIGSIDYMAMKLGLKKDYDFLCHSRKKLKKDFTEDMFIDLYFRKNKSTREIAQVLGIGKNTVAYYFKKYEIPTRNSSEAGKLRATKYHNWNRGLGKEDNRIIIMAEKIKKINARKREERLRRLEEKFGKSILDLINELYWKEGLTQEKIAKKLEVPRELIIQLMKGFNVSKRPTYDYIASLKGINPPLYGKKWEEIYGKTPSDKMKKEMSIRARKNIIRRLNNHEMPFLNTKIEKKVANWLIKKKLPFYPQYVVDKKFVCDFALPLFNMIIECDGDYWHANPKIYDPLNLTKTQTSKVNRDRFKDLYLAKKGWKVFRFFESDIHKNFKNCTNILEAEINEQIKNIKNPLDNL